MPVRLCAALLYTAAMATAALGASDPQRATSDHASRMPVRIESQSDRNEEEGRVRAHLDYSFAEVSDALDDAAAWCVIIALHQNVKACVHDDEQGAAHLRVYNGRKKYQEISSAVITDYRWQRDETEPGHLVVSLTSESGSSHGDYRIVLDARAEPGGGTAVDLRYHCRLSGVAMAALRVYLATEGRDKTGFSIAGYDERGQPRLVTGTRGLIERNALRYYLAMVTYIDSRDVQDANVDSWRARHWYALTQEYAAQLHELDRSEYLDNKRRELARQADLQAAIDRQEADKSSGD